MEQALAERRAEQIGAVAEGTAYPDPRRHAERGFPPQADASAASDPDAAPALADLLKDDAEPVLADVGAGKSYLGFILYDLIFGPAGRGSVSGIEAREPLVTSSRDLAACSGFDRMQFIAAPIAEATLPSGKADMVTALHACDTATDDAIRFALRHDAKVIALVPCCQAEVSATRG